jgi:hypothetical protein
MVYAFETLGYAKRLRDAGVTQAQAEAHAEAARDFIMAELSTKTDLQALSAQTKSDLQALSAQTKADLQSLSAHFDAKLDTLSLRLTVRLGTMLAVGIGVLATIVKLVP